ncbi:DUF6421 family protein [Planomonospora parontospora]|uniref:DUF6421 family protein n=1 Tax=Planomonospora parontospora TaxID=58119 RepID=UPI0019AE3CD8|nr:DUF6421 family protein [Planomonospora parontospora]GGL03497.1 hypothetical protein GCM10014719_02080 [Planomonospora parontospora subsp. antibiotica]GII13368.1 hypothetical protein Ppa05_00940 [Planomonospora parontospora subsp. antibiotica]
MRAFPRVLFDEAHSESWTIRREVAEAMNPGHPDDNSYARAAELLRRLGHTVTAHTGDAAGSTAGGATGNAAETGAGGAAGSTAGGATGGAAGSTAGGAITPAVLDGTDVLVIAHPSAGRWERTTGLGSPVFPAEELDAIETYVAGGGGLVVLAECEQDKYGSNLADLLDVFGVRVEHTTVQDPRNAHNGVASWVMGVPGETGEEDLLAGARRACFYRAGVLSADPGLAPGDVTVLFSTSPTADPAGRPLALAVRHGRGRVVVVADSDLFGDDSIDDHDHAALWGNLVTWAARVPERAGRTGGGDDTRAAFAGLKDAVERLQPLQAKDGSIEGDRDLAVALISEIVDRITELAPRFPHDAAYLDAVVADFGKWVAQGLGVPDFLDSLDAFHPDAQRIDGLEHLVVFPMYTQNGSTRRHVEAVWIRTVWPRWLAELEAARYDNPMFVPIAFEDFTSGYDTDSAVLFPETVAVRETPARFTWGGIFCDREAARFRRVGRAAADTLKLALPPDAARLLESQELAQDTFVLWDLIHDRTHSHGDLPFDPFMIKQRMPYWLYSLEELRCDLTAFGEAVRLEAEGVPHVRYVQHAILFDRLFRFPITGGRVRNYDGLGGQLLFAYLHRNDVVRWTDNRLSVDWSRLAGGVADLRGEVEKLYRDGIDRAKLAHWLAAHELVAAYVEPHPASVWAKGVDALPTDGFPKAVVDAVLPDEFPLSMFYEALRRKLGEVVDSTKGIRA